MFNSFEEDIFIQERMGLAFRNQSLWKWTFGQPIKIGEKMPHELQRG
jgi:hypothetical protein